MSESTIPPVVAVQPGDGWYLLHDDRHTAGVDRYAYPVEYFTVHADGSRRGWLPDSDGTWYRARIGLDESDRHETLTGWARGPVDAVTVGDGYCVGEGLGPVSWRPLSETDGGTAGGAA